MASISARAYRIATDFLYPAAAAQALYTAAVAREWRYVRERLSGRCDDLFTACPSSRRSDCHAPIWLHCASVGELNTATPLIRAWLERYADECFVVTTNTATAAAVFVKKNFPPARVVHRYMPLDYSRSCSRFINELRPKAVWVIETELWLNMFSACARHDIPVFILNARLSEKTLRAAAHRYMRDYYRHCLERVTGILARHEDEAGRYQRCGAPKHIIRVTGNLKYAIPPDQTFPALITQPYFLAASTHPGEESAVAEAFRGKTDNGAGRLLVIAPRHPQRGGRVARQLRKAGFIVARRSANETTDNADIYLVDTVGELPAFIAHAQLVFMGGTLTPVGGHNVLEPAALGTPQVVGPYVGNHANEVRALREADAIQQIHSSEELATVFRRAADGEYTGMAQRARACILQYQTVVENYIDALAAYSHPGHPGRPGEQHPAQTHAPASYPADKASHSSDV